MTRLAFLLEHLHGLPRRGGVLLCCLITLLVATSFGCSRAHYRRQADEEVQRLIECGSTDPRWPLDDFSIQPPAASRLYDPSCPDSRPMPQDDPTSHKLMHCVDCKKGWPCWHCNGEEPRGENTDWKAYLPIDEEGRLVLNRQTATQTGLLHSRDYQQELESLYLSALDVTAERFRFDTQYYGGNATFFTADGRLRNGPTGESSSKLSTDTDFQIQKFTATGAELVVGMANSLVWQFAGAEDHSGWTLLDFSLVQPLLRAGGRALVLENLTQSERNLLANIRQMERYRRGFCAQVLIGRDPGTGPSRSGLTVGSFSAGSASPTSGLVGLMEDQVRIRNQQANVAGLRDSLAQLQAFQEADRIDIFQVDLARQALFNAQSRLLAQKADYESRLDTYKISLGLPPQLNAVVDDPLLDRFDLIPQSIADVRESVTELFQQLGDPSVPVPSDYLDRMKRIHDQCMVQIDAVSSEIASLGDVIPDRREHLRRLVLRPELKTSEVDTSAWSVEALNRRVESIHGDFSRLVEPPIGPLEPGRPIPLKSLLDQLSLFLDDPKSETASSIDTLNLLPQSAEQRARDRLAPIATRLLELSLVQARARLEKIRLAPVDLTPETALEIARANRRDWMNARAALVDQWRGIEVVANDLKSDLDLVFSGDLGTTGENPARFRGPTGRLRVGLEFDAPLTRRIERNAYREQLIDYQQSRRDLQAFEDQVARGLRDILRTIRLAQMNFELRRTAVSVAITQVDITQLRLNEPPKAGAQQKFGATTARDLVQSLSSLLDVQNNFLSEWVDYDVQRIHLDYDLGTMQIDRLGMWIDPGPFRDED